MGYVVEARPSEGIAMINGVMWRRAKARKRNTCAVTSRDINPGDMVYRPLGNGDNRMHRILAEYVERNRP